LFFKEKENKVDIKVKKDELFLCIGDSITDCGRRDIAFPLGNGYVKIFSDLLLAYFSGKKIKVINKGIGGNTVPDLKARWEDDVIYHKPDWLSILIGINDLHRVLGKGPDWESFTPEKYEKNYRDILKRAKNKAGCPIVLLEPFYISNDSTDNWRGQVLRLLEDYRKIVWQLSKEFKTSLVKLQDIFRNNLKYNDADTFCAEPVHPNITGHQIIAQHFFETLMK
jgi:acyl-CoA thioesterase I